MLHVCIKTEQTGTVNVLVKMKRNRFPRLQKLLRNLGFLGVSEILGKCAAPTNTPLDTEMIQIENVQTNLIKPMC